MKKNIWVVYLIIDFIVIRCIIFINCGDYMEVSKDIKEIKFERDCSSVNFFDKKN